MAKFCGMIGFVVPNESSPGVWTNTIQERKYYGDVLKNTKRWENGVSINDNLNISNRISILADSFCRHNLGCMRYLMFMGSAWKITDIEVHHPRLILTLGGLYNGTAKNEDSEDF